ncbi:NAD(P)/FAD-dependent oxidoreductase [Amycolatopsis sp. YIM 10]|uniref:flavin-containing monooxygenase n=1 Tax=Amycolatopsis sp. YIM 10 TaxID=2653857 RepID=UPI0012A937C5|nr:NAD(P)/FAD-dependent oxidoreductase [Amycolatopsis sp. YIM 10]QFU90567.1 4-hydroxyacetophenone monooxygenase [Amycolatopsis sp. YIM 10]
MTRVDRTVLIIGAGFAGLCLGTRLKQAGVRSFRIFERAADIGGTWRDNNYPGSSCDVPSHLYSYSFRKYRGVDKRYSTQREILDYLRGCVADYDLGGHIELRKEVVSATFLESDGQWEVRTADGGRHHCDLLVSAVGQLTIPKYPELPGAREFAGTALHSARWDPAHDVRGERVAVIGTGSSAVQIVPALAGRAGHLCTFQRSPNWILPKPPDEFSRAWRTAFRLCPPLHGAYRGALSMRSEHVLFPALRRGWSTKLMTTMARKHLYRQVGDPGLRERLLPDYSFGCKRIVLSSDYFTTLTRPDVELVTESIEEITPGGIRTVDGRHHDVDTIVYATGFLSTDFLVPTTVTGSGGRDLHEQWKEYPTAYLGMAYPGFPNLLLMYGPNTSLGHNSIIPMLEAQAGYILQYLRELEGRSAGALDVRPEAMDEWEAELGDALSKMVWTESCTAWFKTESGRVTNNWPGRTSGYRRATRRLEPAAYRFIPAAEAAPGASPPRARGAASPSGRQK